MTDGARPAYDAAAFVSHLQAYADAIPMGDRRIVGIAGPPASGKSTLAAEIVRSLDSSVPGSCALLPMDGFHYDDEVLGPRDWQSRKGAPYTFDVGGFAAALRRLKANAEEGIAVPRFDRSIEIARAGAIIIDRDVRLIVTEGNYLLLKDDPWSELARYFDHTALLVVDMKTLEARNRQRWVDIDMDEQAIAAKLDLNDMPNGRLVYERSAAPDWVVHT
jgi:pantothenate kinase